MKYHPFDLIIALSFIGEGIAIFVSGPEYKGIILVMITPIIILGYFLGKWVHGK